MRVLSPYMSVLFALLTINNNTFSQEPETTLIRFSKNSLSLSAEDYYQQGLAHDQSNNPDLAIGFYTLALRQNLAHHRARFNRGLDLKILGRLQEAKEDFDFILENNPNDGEALELRGLVFYEMDLPKEAVADFNEALRLTEKSDIHIHRGLAFMQMNAPYDAFQDFDRILEIEPENALALSYKGEVYASLGQYWEAISLFDKAIALEPNDAYFYNNRGQVFAQLGKFDKALEDFDQAIFIEPKGQMFINRALCLLGKEDLQGAKQDGKTAMLLDPDNSDTYYVIGLSELAAMEYEAAKSSFDVAIDMNPEIGEYYLERGKAYYFEGEYYKAIDDFYKAQKLNSDNEELDEMIQNTYKALDKRNLNWMKENNLPLPNHDLDKTGSEGNTPILYQYNDSKTKSKENEKGFEEDPFH